MGEEQEKFAETWAVVEVMGRQTFAGKVTEQVFGGASLLRVDVPEIPERTETYTSYEYDDKSRAKAVQKERLIPGRPAFTKFIGIGSIYALTPCTEDVARRAAARLQHAPVIPVDLAPASRMIGAGDDDGVE